MTKIASINAALACAAFALIAIACGETRAPDPVESRSAPSGSAQTSAGADDAPVAFEHKPEPGSKATCPVMKHAFTVTKESEFSVHNGKTYVFCCPGCKPKFDADPARYTTG